MTNTNTSTLAGRNNDHSPTVGLTAGTPRQTPDADQEDTLDFSGLEPKQVTFCYRDKWYVLREATESAHLQYQSHNMQGARIVDGKVQADLEKSMHANSLLVSLCLYHADPEYANDRGREPLRPNPKTGEPDNAHRVTLDVVRGWPHQMTKRLYEKIVGMSMMRNEEGEEFLRRRIAGDTEKLARLRRARAAASRHDGEGECEDAGGN